MLERGNEFGTTTGRQRRCGWIDLVALRYAARLSGFTELALTKLDVLSGFTRVRICDAYQTREGELLSEFPYHQTVFHGCTPVYRDLDGWDEDISECRWLKQLPEAARRYVETIAAAVEVPITLIGTGQGRHQVIDTVEF
jgi:adenylosuccinate synthase